MPELPQNENQKGHEPTPSPYTNDFLTVRVIVMMETANNSGVFEQIVYGFDSRKRILDAIRAEMRPIPESTDGGFIITTNDNFTVEFPEIRDMYSPEELQKMYDEADEED